jgi:hypothetical protein
LYVLRCRAYDSLGTLSANTAVQLVSIGGAALGESEDNDVAAMANDLPAFPVSQLIGSVGYQADWPLNDNDDVDYYRFFAAAGQELEVDLSSSSGPGNVYIVLQDGAGQNLAQVMPQGDPPSASLSHTFSADGSYYLSVLKLPIGPANIYSLSASLD